MIFSWQWFCMYRCSGNRGYHNSTSIILGIRKKMFLLLVIWLMMGKQWIAFFCIARLQLILEHGLWPLWNSLGYALPCGGSSSMLEREIWNSTVWAVENDRFLLIVKFLEKKICASLKIAKAVASLNFFPRLPPWLLSALSFFQSSRFLACILCTGDSSPL